MLNNFFFQKQQKAPRLSLILVFLWLSYTPVSHAQLTQSQSTNVISFYLPLHSSQQTKSIENFKQALLKAGFDDITVKTADFWSDYQQKIRKGRIGIYLAPPHFSAWVIHHHNFMPLVRVKGPLKYVIASKRSEDGVFEIRDLTRKEICTQHALNLDYLLINQSFQNSVRSANTVIVNSVINEMQKQDSPCSGFSISEHAFQALDQQSPGRYIRLTQSDVFSNYAIVMHPSLINQYSAALTEFLNSKAAIQSLAPILKLNSNEATFIKASKLDYPQHDSQMLELFWK